MTIYLVKGVTGMYEDIYEWEVKAFKDEIAAVNHCMKANHFARSLSYIPISEQSKDIVNPYDPLMTINWATGVGYKVVTVEYEE